MTWRTSHYLAFESVFNIPLCLETSNQTIAHWENPFSQLDTISNEISTLISG